MIKEQVKMYNVLKKEILKLEETKENSKNPIVIKTLSALCEELNETAKGLTETILEIAVREENYADKLNTLTLLNSNVKVVEEIIQISYNRIKSPLYCVNDYSINEEFLNFLIPFYNFHLEEYKITEKDLDAFEVLIYPEPLILFPNQKLKFYCGEMMVEIIKYYFANYRNSSPAQAVGKKVSKEFTDYVINIIENEKIKELNDNLCYSLIFGYQKQIGKSPIIQEK